MRKLSFGLSLAAALSVISAPAYAYLDPGTASILIQSIVGGIAAGFAVISLNYQRLKSKIMKWRSKPK